MAEVHLLSRSEDVRQRVTVTGVVQGVGFRPFVHRVATELGLSGFVGNNSGAVFLEVQGRRARVARILSAAARRIPTAGADHRGACDRTRGRSRVRAPNSTS